METTACGTDDVSTRLRQSSSMILAESFVVPPRTTAGPRRAGRRCRVKDGRLLPRLAGVQSARRAAGDCDNVGMVQRSLQPLHDAHRDCKRACSLCGRQPAQQAAALAITVRSSCAHAFRLLGGRRVLQQQVSCAVAQCSLRAVLQYHSLMPCCGWHAFYQVLWYFACLQNTGHIWSATLAKNGA